jgi:hypothetical protein
MHQESPQDRVYVDIVFARVEYKPRLVEEHDSWGGAVLGGRNARRGKPSVRMSSSMPFGNQAKSLRLTPAPKRVLIGIISRKADLGRQRRGTGQCARESFRAIGRFTAAVESSWFIAERPAHAERFYREREAFCQVHAHGACSMTECDRWWA